MARLTLHVNGPASPELAWERYADISRWTSWAPHLTTVTASAERIAPGVTGVVTALWLVPARFHIDDVDQASRSWSWVVRSGPVRMRLVHTVDATTTGCRTGLEVYGQPGVIHAYAPVAWAALRRLVGEG